jgi:hypothetical protein
MVVFKVQDLIEKYGEMGRNATSAHPLLEEGGEENASNVDFQVLNAVSGGYFVLRSA